jgi:ABC-type transport system substrate-binding protein
LTIIPSRNPTLRDLRVREAIALAIGREEVAKVSDIVKPATSLVPDKLPGFDATVGFDENVARARELLAQAGYPNGKGFPRFSIMTTDDDPYIRVVVRTLHQNLGIDAVQDVEDPSIENAKRAEVQPASFIGYFATGYGEISTWRDWVYKYPPAQTEALSLTPGDYTKYTVLQAQGTAAALSTAADLLTARASAQSRRFATVAASADATTNPDQAVALYKQAAAIRQSTFEFIPFAYGARVFVVRPNIHGVHVWAGYPAISFKGVSVG